MNIILSGKKVLFANVPAGKPQKRLYLAVFFYKTILAALSCAIILAACSKDLSKPGTATTPPRPNQLQ